MSDDDAETDHRRGPPRRTPHHRPAQGSRIEPDGARHRGGRHLPAGPEIREGHEQDRREPASANRAIPQGRNRVFFDGLSEEKQQGGFAEEGTAYVIDFLNSSEGLQLNPAFARIKDPRVKRRLIGLVNALANLEQSDEPQVPRRGRKPKVR